MKQLLFLLICFPFILVAQLLDQGYLVNSKDIGDDLLLFVPDSSVQIIKNSARAAKYKGEFVYITKSNNISQSIVSIPLWEPTYYRTTSRINRSIYHWRPVLFSELNNDFNDVSTINLAYLFGGSKNKWLLKIVSTDNSSKSEDFNQSAESDFDYSYTQDQETTRKNKSAFHQISINKTGSLSFANFSLGAVAGISETNYLYAYDRNYLSDYQYTDSRNVSIRHYLRKEENNLKNLFLGLEFNLSTDTWDITSSVHYIKSDYQDILFDNQTNENPRYDSSGVLDFHGFADRDDIQKEQINADAILADLYLRKSINLFNQKSDLFIAASGYYSFEDQQLKTRVDRYSQTYYVGQDTSEYDIFTERKKKFGNVSESYNLRSGLILNYTKEDIYFLTGLTGMIMYSSGDKNSFHLINDEILAGDVEFDEYFYQLEIPIYINYSPTDWFEIYTGFHFAYLYQDYSFSDIINEATTNNVAINEVDKQKSDNFGNFQKTYLGVNLKSKSGLRAQINFQNTLSSYRSWDFSLGYVF